MFWICFSFSVCFYRTFLKQTVIDLRLYLEDKNAFCTVSTHSCTASEKCFLFSEWRWSPHLNKQRNVNSTFSLMFSTNGGLFFSSSFFFPRCQLNSKRYRSMAELQITRGPLMAICISSASKLCWGRADSWQQMIPFLIRFLFFLFFFAFPALCVSPHGVTREST